MSNNKKIVYITSSTLRKQCDKIPVVKKRASMVHSLICAYGLDKEFTNIQKERQATADELALFHSSSYIEYLYQQNDKLLSSNTTVANTNYSNCCTQENPLIDDDDSGDDDDDDDDDDEEDDLLDETVNDEQLEYGIGYDCPKISDLWSFVSTIAGGTLTAVEELTNGNADIVINWCGGWHHAQRDEAEGFCYINDIGIGLQKMREKFKRILYCDLDVHHGNGVENGFSYSKRVFTLSFHQYEAGFFPGTGNVMDIGAGNGKGYTCNFPYKSYISGDRFCKYFKKVFDCIVLAYQPEACVVQCGADVIVGDPLGSTNLVPEHLGECVEQILKLCIPTIFLGGGGYNLINTSRYWTYLTSIICGKKITENDDIPDHSFFLKYGPGYELKILPKTFKDQNDDNELEQILQKIIDHLKFYKICLTNQS